MPSPILQALYEGRRADAEALADETEALDEAVIRNDDGLAALLRAHGATEARQ